MKTKIETLINTIIDKKLGDVVIKQQSINVTFPSKFFSVTAPNALPYTDYALVELQLSGLQKHVDKLVGSVDTPVVVAPVVEAVKPLPEPVVEHVAEEQPVEVKYDAIVVPEEVTEVVEPTLSAQSLMEKIANKSHLKKR